LSSILTMMSPPIWMLLPSSWAGISPALMPALSAGQVEVLQRAVDGQRLDSQIAPIDPSGLLELRDDLLGGVDRHGEPDPDVRVAAVAAGGDL
jgi:hypothetical protein